MGVPGTMENTPKRSPRPVWLVAAAVLAVVAAIGAVVFLLVNDSSDSATPSQATGATDTPPFAVSAAGLATIAGAVPDAIYWAGPRNAKLYELTKAAKGDVILRYLPRGADAGYKGKLLSVGTYPFKNAYSTAQRVMAKPDTVSVPVAGGALAFHSAGSSTNVYVVFPGIEAQVEVFSPKPGEAEQIVKAGEVVRIR
jgi:hypothetical protein